MNDLIAAAAVIQGAQIQANFALWAAVLSSFIGAFGIIFAANYAYKSGLKTHQKNNILEAKREVYLDAIAQYHHLINSLQFVNIIPNNFLEILLNNNKEFYVCINKVKLICETETKQIINNFAYEVHIKMFEMMPIFDNLIKLYSENEEIILKTKDLNEKNNILNDINISNISKTQELDVKHKLNLLDKEYEYLREKITENANQIAISKDIIANKIDEAIVSLAELELKFSIALRQELKIPTNEELERKIDKDELDKINESSN